MYKLANFLLTALFVMTISSLTAQVNIGFRAGYAANNVYTTSGLGAIAPNFQKLSEANLGLVLEIPITDQFSVQPEVAFTTKGFGLSQGVDAQVLGVDVPLGASAETRIKYIEIPVLAKYKFGSDILQAYFTAGPTIGYATGGQIDTKVKALLEFDLGSVPLNLDNLNYNRLEVGATVGAGLQLDLGPVQAFTDVRYFRGFTELYNIPLVDEKVRNSGLGVNVGLMIPIGG